MVCPQLLGIWVFALLLAKSTHGSCYAKVRAQMLITGGCGTMQCCSWSSFCKFITPSLEPASDPVHGQEEVQQINVSGFSTTPTPKKRP
ncbi:hypothetical protein BDW71DRAFT_20210 [Aspergillus fruticulosus]